MPDLTVVYLGIAFLITFAGAIFVSIKLGESREENRIAKANLQAAKKIRQTEEAIRALSDADLDKRMSDEL